MRSVEENHLEGESKLVKIWTAEDLAVSHETVERARRKMSESEIFLLVVQCSMLVVIAGIVAGLIAA